MKAKFVRTIAVDLCRNDPVDIRCGGPSILGFDYTVDCAVYKEALAAVKAELEHHNAEPIGISSSGRRKVLGSQKTWTVLGIKRNMRKEFKNWLLSEYRRSQHRSWWR